MPIRVLVISDYRSFHTVRPEAEIFIALAKKGLEITVMTFGDSAYVQLFREAGIDVIEFHPTKKLDKLEIQTIKDVLVKKKIDILHLFNSQAIINGIQAAKNLPVKIVLYRGYTGNIHWYDPSMYIKYLHPRVDAIQCNSVGVANLFKRQLFFNKSKAYAINKGHRIEWYQDVKPADVRREFNIEENALVLINVANNRKMKGIPYLLKAMAMLDENLPIHLLLVGRDMDTTSNLSLINNSPAKSKVHFTGFRSDALSLVAGADVFVLSSLFGESITKAVIEAMSLGIPPIITDIPGNVELVENNKSGLIVKSKNPKELKDAIMKLYTNPELRKNLGIEAREHIKTKLNTENTAERVYAMYKELLEVKIRSN